MAAEARTFDWRVPAIWAAILAVSVVAHAYVEASVRSGSGEPTGFERAAIIEVASHLVIAALLPAIYWLHRRWPVGGRPSNIAVHVAALIPFSLAHTLGMAALRFLWFGGVMGESYAFPLTFERFAFEFSKDIINYAALSAGTVALRYMLDRFDAPSRPASAPAAPVTPPERFAVRKRGGSEVMVEVADIDWIEAAGNYAILHVGGETFEIRSSLTKLEGELDPKRFVRVHKSHLVNIARVAEVVPWVSGDWRIRMQDGAEVNLSRRYRQRFEALAPVRS